MVGRQDSRNLDFNHVRTWLAITVVPLFLQTVLLQDKFTLGLRFESPIGLFGLVVAAASLCVLTSALLLRRATTTATPELVGVGLFFMAVSAMPLAHGITTPGVLFDQNSANPGTAMWAISVGLLAASPNLAPASIRRAYFPTYWRLWLAVWLLVIFGISVGAISLPNTLPLFTPGGTLERCIAVISIAGTLMLSYRQVRLAQIARSRGPLLISAGYSLVASSALVWFGAAPYSIGFWTTYAFDIVGVSLATLGALVLYRKTDDVRDALLPILVAEPLSALELGLEPLVHDFVADLEAKDTITRDHVVRTAELSLAVGEELGYNGDKLRHISLIGLLHDVGKLDVPDTVLKKSGKLTQEEFDIIKRHPSDGARRVRQSVLLAPLAEGILGHHERIDGRGYPRGLQGDEIPIEARVVAACDAYDAMANTRQYRSGMGKARAISILREHQGSQWDAEVVNALVRVLDRQSDDPPGLVEGKSPALANVGRQGGDDSRVGCDCLPEVFV